MSSVGVVVRTSICSTVSIISTSATESFAFDIEKPKMVKAVRPKSKPVEKVLFLNAFLIKSMRVSTVLLKTIPIRLFFFRYFIIFDTSSSLKED
jgi:hypothetical protein